jgi:LmbE family N-acetylglucosaminyl deacetylase
MSGLFLSPHNDDEALFGAFSIQNHHPHVAVIFKSQVMQDRGTGITAAIREAETNEALAVLGVKQWTQHDWLDTYCRETSEHRITLTSELTNWLPAVYPPDDYERVWAPYPYPGGGAPQHDALGYAALAAYGQAKVTLYHTYVDGRERVKGQEVVPDDPDFIRRKLCALACYESQINYPPTGHHFMHALNEYVA